MTLPTKLLMQLRATPGTVDIGQFDQPRFNGAILLLILQDSMLCTARLSHHTACATLAKLLVVHCPCDRFAALHGCQNFL